MAWGKNGTPDTLTGTENFVEITDLSKKKFNHFMSNALNVTAMNSMFQMGVGSIDVSDNYASRRKVDGGTENTSIDQFAILSSENSNDDPVFFITYLINISGEEKLTIHHGISRNTLEAAPTRSEVVGKYDITTGQIDGFRHYNQSEASIFLTDSNLSALGTN